MNATSTHRWLLNIGPDNGFLPSGNTPLPEIEVSSIDDIFNYRRKICNIVQCIEHVQYTRHCSYFIRVHCSISVYPGPWRCIEYDEGKITTFIKLRTLPHQTGEVLRFFRCHYHYNDVIMSAIASQITSLTNVYSDANKKHQSSAVTGLCVGNSPVTGEFPTQRASNAESVSIWWRHHDRVN